VPFSYNAVDEADESDQAKGLLQNIYEDLLKAENEKHTAYTANQQVKTEPESAATTENTSTVVTTTTTTAVAAPGTTNDTTPTAATVPSVSNGKREFNYGDVSSIASNLKTLRNFVEELNPTSFSWDTSDYEKYGYVKIFLISSYGNVTLDVKPVEDYKGNGQYLIDNEVTGSVNASSITDWDWYNQNKQGGCNICSITWLSDEFAIAPVRGVRLGENITDLINTYLCVNGGATTLYKASDVITDQNKLNALLEVENAYTFVGGRVYTTDSYISKYYPGKSTSYRFADSNFVVQYGCNSIMDYNYTTGSWILEYAVKNDVVVGITFMNKSYNEAMPSKTNSDVTDESSDDTTSTSTASTTAFEQLFGE
jgi:hypothetical protein